jgi:membrane protease YdiL (CAAX protease family)
MSTVTRNPTRKEAPREIRGRPMNPSPVSVSMQNQTEPQQGTLGAWVRRHPVIAFSGLAYMLSWLAWLPWTLGYRGAAGVVLFVLGGFGPAASAAAITRLTGGSVRAWARGIFRWRVPVRFYLYALGFPVLVWGVMNLVLAVLGRDIELSLLLDRAPAYVTTLVFVSLLGGGFEEPGWRGFALPRLEARFTPVRATLVLGLVWGLWHLPVYGLAFVGPMFFVFPYTYLYNRTRSVLLCILLHGAFTAAQDHLVLLPEHANVTVALVMLGTLIATSAILVAATRGRLGYTSGKDDGVLLEERGE